MNQVTKKRRIETKAIVLGYAMSRLDTKFLMNFSYPTWSAAFKGIGTKTGIPAASIKNLRDEFDPFHTNRRKGWHKRELRQNRQRVMDELAVMSESALIEFVSQLIGTENSGIVEAIDSMAVVTGVAYNVAERLLTGRRAEEYFVRKCMDIVEFPTSSIIDYREKAKGFDFGVKSDPEIAIEVKGMKSKRGQIQFTDKEWSEAALRRERYLVVVVAILDKGNLARVFPDPHASLVANCRYQRSLTATWHTTVSIANK